MKKLLVLNFFPAFTPPGSGGELRYYNLYKRISSHFDVTLLSPTYTHHPREVVRHSDYFREYRIPKEPIHDVLHRKLAQEQIAQEISALVCALSAQYPNSYHKAYLELYEDADVIVHESPYMLEYDLFFGADDKIRIYNSYNVESALVQQIWQGRNAEVYIEYIKQLEGKLLGYCDLCFAVSEEEKDKFTRDFNIDSNKIIIASNGINPDEYMTIRRNQDKKSRPLALFIGSFFPPNIEAARFIIDELADQCPNADFHIAGSCIEKETEHGKPNVQIHGRVSDQTKYDLLSKTTIAINPIFRGAGTSLKVLEYLSSGIPLLSTELGTRGLNMEAEKHFIAATRKDFALKLHALAQDKELQTSVARLGRQHVNSFFSWNTIADQVCQAINSVEQSKKAKLLFILNDFEVNTPKSGGEVRIHEMYRCLSKNYRIFLLCFNERGLINRTDITSSFIELSVPKEQNHLEATIKENSKFWISASDIVSSMYAAKNKLFSEVTKTLYSLCDSVIVSHPYMVGALNGLHGKPVIYESHNYEYGLKQHILKDHPNFTRLMESVKACETEVINKSHFIVSVSDQDHAGLHLLSGNKKNIYTIPNGVNTEKASKKLRLPEIKELFKNHPVILFIGSAHQPNIESLYYIKGVLAPAMPDCFFIVIGSVCGVSPIGNPKNLLLFGERDEEYKEALFSLADIAINPISSGSGSNLKLAEYLSYGIPTVTTLFGARGYQIQNGKEAILCELSEFQEKVHALLRSPNLRRTLSENGYRYAKLNLDWKILADRFHRIIQKEIFLSDGQKRLLVVTYRFTDPPLGGAEIYLLEVLRQLAKSDVFKIDVATLNIITIYNQFHFSCRYTYDSYIPTSLDLKDVDVYRFKADSLPDKVNLAGSRTLFKRWMQEFRNSSLRHKDKLKFPILMGGWHYPEYIGDKCEIWSSDESLLFVKGTQSVRFSGYAPQKTEVRCSADQAILFKKTISGNFQLDIPLNDNTVLSLKTNRLFEAKNDPRPLGVRVQSIECHFSDAVFQTRLDFDYKAYLKVNYLESYIEELISIAVSRPQEFDDLFQRTRGPLSQELEAWLSQNAQNYDIVLAHNIPFATSVMAVKKAKEHHIPVITIPFFHIDDEFYHWNSYYDALKRSEALITCPKAASKLFFDKIQCKSSYLPYGIHLDEKPLNEDKLAFLSLYRSDLPYVLVLGRKDRSKNYGFVLEAVKKVNSQRKVCNVVMIGSDEDGVAINPAEAIYLGAQPRHLVLAALHQSLCLISMSESESFGIVILESWAQKRPVIVNQNCIASTELVDDTVNGLYASKDNLHEKISCLIDNGSIASHMGEAGYKKVIEEFTWDTVSAKLIQLLNKVVSNK